MWWDGSGHGGWSAGNWVAMGLMMLVFWALVAAAVVWVVRSSRQQQPVVLVKGGDAGRSRAEAVLAERFARGEIDEAEFTRRREVLRGSSDSRP